MATTLDIMPFGGVRENGMNMYAVTVDEDIFILDAGLKYPESDLLGVDVVIPDYAYLVEHADNVAGVFLTHWCLALSVIRFASSRIWFRIDD